VAVREVKGRWKMLRKKDGTQDVTLDGSDESAESLVVLAFVQDLARIAAELHAMERLVEIMKEVHAADWPSDEPSAGADEDYDDDS
jgi:hypothetical protein